MAASGALQQNITIESVDTVTWFSPPDDANIAYAFCSRCGSSLFWRVVDQEDDASHWSICAGTLDDRTGLATDEVWFSDRVASYTRLDDSVVWLSSVELGESGGS